VQQPSARVQLHSELLRCGKQQQREQQQQQQCAPAQSTLLGGLPPVSGLLLALLRLPAALLCVQQGLFLSNQVLQRGLAAH
jgi:hypothetical protein